MRVPAAQGQRQAAKSAPLLADREETDSQLEKMRASARKPKGRAMKKLLLGVGVVLAGTLGAYVATAQAPTGILFITSDGPGNGANLGGLAGADAYCQKVAAAAGLQNPQQFVAYLSTQASGNTQAVNARDRIFQGELRSVKGDLIARNIDDLHSPQSGLNKMTAINERGQVVNGRGDNPNRHDMLTGSLPDGRAFPASAGDETCQNYTSSSTGKVRLGHHDRQGGGQAPTSFNSAHDSAGCSQQQLVSTGGDGLFYCATRAAN
jgi:hypothetical protein